MYKVSWRAVCFLAWSLDNTLVKSLLGQKKAELYHPCTARSSPCAACKAHPPPCIPLCPWTRVNWGQKGLQGTQSLASCSLKASSPKPLTRLGPQNWQVAQTVARMNVGKTNSLDRCCCIWVSGLQINLFQCAEPSLLPPGQHPSLPCRLGVQDHPVVAAQLPCSTVPGCSDWHTGTATLALSLQNYFSIAVLWICKSTLIGYANHTAATGFCSQTVQATWQEQRKYLGFLLPLA